MSYTHEKFKGSTKQSIIVNEVRPDFNQNTLNETKVTGKNHILK